MTNDPATALSWWTCNCPEYNNHSIGAIDLCKKCGKKEPAKDTNPPEMSKNIEELSRDNKRLYDERDMFKRMSEKRRGLVTELREAMGIQENMNDDQELKQALQYVRSIQSENNRLKETIGKFKNEVRTIRK